MQGRHHVCARPADVGAQLTATRRVIGIDGSRTTAALVTGTERYSIELLRALADIDPPEDIRVYLNAHRPPTDIRYPGTPVLLPSRRLWTLRTLSREMRHSPPDVLFVPSHIIPPAHPKSVVTVHDIGYLVEPDAHPARRRLELEWTTRWNVHAAAGIIAVSESTRDDLVDRLHVDPARIEVINLGVGFKFTPADPDEVSAIRKELGIGNRVILAVGSMHPRKNLIRLIRAFEQLAADDPDLQLVLCGAPGWHADQILRRAHASPFHDRIRVVGYLPDGRLATLYSAAAVLAFPSLYEGFGLPALEAMACGTPVVAADRSSLPEIAGNAAVLVDPFDTESIAEGIRRVLVDSKLRVTLVERGFARAKLFTWERCAIETLAFLRAIGDN